jgi:hypothetical protein
MSTTPPPVSWMTLGCQFPRRALLQLLHQLVLQCPLAIGSVTKHYYGCCTSWHHSRHYSRCGSDHRVLQHGSG